MALPLLPALLDLTETEEASVDIANGMGRAIVQDASYKLELQVLDENGDPFSLGPTASPKWEAHAQLRSSFYDNDSQSAQLTFVCTVANGPIGLIDVEATPALTAAITATSGRWDIELENLSDTNFDVGYSQILFAGKWKLFQDVTRD